MGKDTDDKMDWMRQDMKYLRDKQDDLLAEVKKQGEKLEIHTQNCPAIKALNSPKSIIPSPRNSLTKSANIMWYATKLGPLILTTALALVALGAYFGKQGDFEQKLEKIQKVVEKGQ